MARDWEAVFQSWGQPPSQTEQDKCSNSERAVRKAISQSPALASRSVNVFAQGSYANRTNVKADSDVDICVLCHDSFFYDIPPGMTDADFGLGTPATYRFPEFRNDVEAALVAYFGRAAVVRGRKAFDVHENTYRISADVVACFDYRRYEKSGRPLEGTAFQPDGGSRIINWPKQNYDNGVTKNDQTSRRFKALVRILKRLRNEMVEGGIQSASPIPSFLTECLSWNVPNGGFGHDTLTADVGYALAYLFNKTTKDEDCQEWGEINELKYLFRTAQPWTRAATNSFLVAAWNYVGFR